MIYTVTLNPAIDYFVRVKHLHVGSVNRMDSSAKFPGGKGINVSRMLARQEVESIAMGFLGGFTGEFIKSVLSLEGINTQFITIAEDTRINVKLKSDSETEINGVGPNISAAELEMFMQRLEDIRQGDIVVFAGSAPASLGNASYRQMIELVRQQGAEVICDFEGDTLIEALAFAPLLVKPNKAELEAIYNVKLDTLDEILTYGARLRASGAQNVIVSLAGSGALMLTEGGNYFAKPIKGSVKNSVGAGDSMVAGFTGAFAETGDVQEAFKLGVACGTATAFSDDLATHDFIMQMVEKVRIEEIGRG